MDFRIYQDQGLFSTQQITAAVNRIPYAPRLIQALNIFADVPVNTTTPIIEQRIGARQVIPAVPVGVRNNNYDAPVRKGDVAKALSINTSSMVTKLDAIGVRRFGTQEVESVAAILSDRLEWMRQDSIESTIESMRMQALLGTVKNPDGTVLWNWYNFFDVSPTPKNFVASSIATGAGVRGYCKEVKDIINDALKGIACSGFVGILGDNAWNKLFSVDEIKDSYKYRSTGDQSNAVAFMTEIPGSPNPNQTSINWGALANIFTYGGITFMNYRSSVDFPTDKGVFFPVGVRDMFQSILAPSSLIEEDGAMGSPFYARTWPREDGSGIEIYVESNRIEANTMPDACIQATFS